MLWSGRALLSLQWQLRRQVHDPQVSPPWVSDPGSTRWVRALVVRTPVTCLARSLVLQRWFLALGQPRNVIVAVTAPARGFKAHAWLDGDPAPVGYTELTVRTPPTVEPRPTGTLQHGR